MHIRRLAFWAGLVALLGGAMLLAVVLFTQGVERANNWAGVLSASVALGGALVALVTGRTPQIVTSPPEPPRDRPADPRAPRRHTRAGSMAPDQTLGANTQDGLYAQGKKTLHATFILIVLLLLIGAVVGISLTVSTNRLILLISSAGVGTLIALPSVWFVFWPFNLRINAHGIELKAMGHSISYRWKDIGKVTVRRMQPDVAKHGIYIYLAPGAPLPKTRNAYEFYDSFPRLEAGWILVAPIRHFRVSYAEIETALAQFAGSRWDPD